ncbi:hypothetical protein TrVE_jg323 [Triparma verrucosa]|uniref:Uncharacterized protein n=1 Tax=Triparma verrucosa TaxID=1606542 RepID=A0A9W7BEU8_9STRA|nr:hypothetical protein TrVE_jg323 [Triparma verrucosa]
MLYLRGVELFAECIPGCLIQAIAYINTNQTTIAALSLMSSLLTAAFISASMTIEKDVVKENRIKNPTFYGFIPLDFTAGFMARHPYEFRGAYFSFTMISTPVVCFYFGSRYLSYVEGEEAKEKLKNIFSSELVYGAIGGLIFLQMVSSFMFLRLIEPKYRSSFLSLKTGSQHVVETFRTATNERAKIGVMNNHRSMWKEIEEDVRVWLNENLEKWIEEEQEWFNEGVRAMVLDDLVDDPELLKVLRRPEEGDSSS